MDGVVAAYPISSACASVRANEAAILALWSATVATPHPEIGSGRIYQVEIIEHCTNGEAGLGGDAIMVGGRLRASMRFDESLGALGGLG